MEVLFHAGAPLVDGVLLSSQTVQNAMMADSAAPLQYHLVYYARARLHLKTTCLLGSNIYLYVGNSDLGGCRG